jgi:chloramphenicol O-acetyltransferase type A
MNQYRTIDPDHYYRKGIYSHFTKDCMCSCSITARIDVSDLVTISKATDTKFYLNFLYLISRVLNSREDYRMAYLWKTEELISWDVIHPTQYVFHEDTETFTLAYTEYCPDYKTFYDRALEDLAQAKNTREYGLDAENHPNWFDASYISWLSYDSLNIELPDGYLYFLPIINWGKYREENGRLMMPVTVRMNHAVADGFLIANVFRLLEQEIEAFISERENP